MLTPNFIATPPFVHITNSALQMRKLGLERFGDTPKAALLLTGGITIQTQVQGLLGPHLVNSTDRHISKTNCGLMHVGFSCS